MWLEQRQQAEVALEGRDSLLFDSACNIEKDLELLGKINPLVFPLVIEQSKMYYQLCALYSAGCTESLPNFVVSIQ